MILIQRQGCRGPGGACAGIVCTVIIGIQGWAVIEGQGQLPAFAGRANFLQHSALWAVRTVKARRGAHSGSMGPGLAARKVG